MKIALIGDIVNSKQLDKRSEVQSRLINLLNEVNSDFKSKIELDLEITQGDEFQGVFRSADCFLLVIDKINIGLYPTRIRWGIGVGELVTNHVNMKSANADGSAYWNARAAIVNVEQKNNRNTSLTAFISGDSHSDRLINSMLKLQDAISSRWTKSQRLIIADILNRNGYESYSNKEVAEGVKVIPSRVSNVVSESHFQQYSESRDILEKHIGSLFL